MQRFKRVGFTVGLVTVWFAGCLAAQAMASGVTFEIAAGSATTTLKQFAAQAHMQLLFDFKAVQSLKTPALKGQLEPTEALRILLQGSGLTFRQVNDHTIAVMALGSEPPASGTTPANQTSGSSSDTEGKKSSSDGFRLAQATPGQTQGDASVEKRQTPEKKSDYLQEVIVTAQKREERLQDVPVPVTTISAQSLIDSNQLRLQDYYTSIPGLSVTPGIQSAQFLSIRGVTTGAFTNPTVGIVIDDVPYGSSTVLGGGQVVPDIDPDDLARVEVLRGPQGTLYGASSMGGLLKFVTVDPSTDGVSGKVQAGTSSVYNGAELGYSFRASVNVPLSDTVAVLANGFTRENPGYIDNPVRGDSGINEERVDGGRLSALWRPTDGLSLKFSALLQHTEGRGSNDVDVEPGLGDLQQNYIPGVGGYDRKVQAYSATLTTKVGGVDLTTISGYSVNSFSDSFDYTSGLGGLTNAFFPGFMGSPLFYDNTTNKFTQELRLSAPIGETFDWLFGAYYTHEHSTYIDNIQAANATTGAIVGTGLYESFPTTYEDYAAFTDLTFHFTERFDIQVGGRESQLRQTFTETQIGPYVPLFNNGAASPFVIPEVDAKANAFTYLVTPRFNVGPDLMVYARLASGYRAGGPNAAPGGVVPAQYNPDKTQNYEMGVKGESSGHTVSFDASLYYITWKDIQLSLVNPKTESGYQDNGS